MQRAQPHIAQLAFVVAVPASVTKNPALCPGWPDPQIQAAAIRLQPGLLRLRDRNGPEPRYWPRHERSRNRPMPVPYVSSDFGRTRVNTSEKGGGKPSFFVRLYRARLKAAELP